MEPSKDAERDSNETGCSSGVFTVGNEGNYDRGLREYPGRFRKLGRRGNYAGGFAVASYEDAKRLIDEQGKSGEWAVYELECDMDRDTVPSENGWWRALVVNSVVRRKVTG